MLQTLTLSNFRQHTDLTVNLAEGLNSIRGANESGKSTILLSLQYALFGTRCLPTSLEETVTWGKPVKDLKVSLTANLHGRTLTFNRGKSGAEVIEGNTVLVTGQQEVSNFAAEMLGGDLVTCNKLLFANQGSLRGALSEGNKAVAELIEELADFDLFDRLIDLIQHKLVVGSPDVIQSRLQQAEATLAGLALPPAPGADKRVPALQRKVAQTEAALASTVNTLATLEKWAEANQGAHTAHWQAVAESDLLVKKQEEALARVTTLAAQPAIATIDATPLKAALKAAESLTSDKLAYQTWSALKPPKNFWEGDVASLDAEIDKVRDAAQSLQVQTANLKGDIRTWQASIILSLTCPTCGTTLKDAEAIKAKNAELQAKIDAAQAGIADAVISEANAKTELSALLEVRSAHDSVTALAHRLGDRVQVLTGQVPPTLAWQGPVTFPDVDIPALKKQIVEAEATWTALAKQQGALESAKAEYESVMAITITIPPDVEGYPQNLDERIATMKVRDNLKTEIADLKVEVRVAQAEVAQAEAEYRAKIAQHEGLQKEIAERRADLSSLAFNNTLLKKVRAARPQVADKLWNTVLTSVSQMFSQMRGEQSIVTKSKDGFAVNGSPISSLSGSTLDLLALAIRCSLTRTFIPQASFMLMDEISAACDLSRTESMLGFIKTVGFKQIILVSHEDVVDSISDHLITL